MAGLDAEARVLDRAAVTDPAASLVRVDAADRAATTTDATQADAAEVDEWSWTWPWPDLTWPDLA